MSEACGLLALARFRFADVPISRGFDSGLKGAAELRLFSLL
jgi:hypothetical protein